MQFRSSKELEIFKAISRITEKAYTTPSLIASNVLAKSVVHLPAYREYVIRGRTIGFSFWACILNVLLNYLNSLKQLRTFFGVWRVARKSIKRDIHQVPAKCDILFESVINIRKTLEANAIVDTSTPDIHAFLSTPENALYIPRFIGPQSGSAITTILALLKELPTPFLTEYQALTPADICCALLFMLSHPLRILTIALRLHRSDKSPERVVATCLIQQLPRSELSAYLRYLFGKKLGKSLTSPTHCLSWHENQVFTKSFYRGLRDSASHVRITGLQTFIWSREILNIHTDISEIKHHVIPDRLLVNGPAYSTHLPQVAVELGPSLRYQHVFKPLPIDAEPDSILILLPAYDEQVHEILQLTKNIGQLNERSIFKFHPFSNSSDFRHLLPPHHELSQEPLETLLSKAKLVLGVASGTLVEAACHGIPSIVPRLKSHLTLNPHQSTGKGIVWDYATSPDDVLDKARFFVNKFETKDPDLKKMAAYYKRHFFTLPTEKNIAAMLKF